jgi:hypothetical protein
MQSRRDRVIRVCSCGVVKRGQNDLAARAADRSRSHELSLTSRSADRPSTARERAVDATC